MKITENENKVLRAIATNCFNACNYDMPECAEDACNNIYADMINDAGEPSGIEGKALSGVCASLAKKGLVSSDDETICMTAAGYTAMINHKS